jgi:DNA-binding LacI/PurR family transcriptional regulator
MRERKATSFDIAFRAGVSQSTVSRALRNSPLVTPETRARIQAIARELNYRVDKHAASLRSQCSSTLALLIFEDSTTDDSQINPFFLSMLGSVTRCAATRGYDVLISFQQLQKDWHTEYELSSRADGLILLGYGDYVRYQKKLERLEQSGAHFIIWGPMVEDQPGHSIGCDNFNGAAEATRHLLALGHREIAFIGGASAHCPEFLHRYQGHVSALADMNIVADSTLQADAENSEQDGFQAVRQLLADKCRFTALCCASDLIAIGAIRALGDAGLRVPDNIAVVGFDDIPAASYMYPPLTTVHQDTLRAGELLVESLINLINGEPVEYGLLTPSLVIRESCGAGLR